MQNGVAEHVVYTEMMDYVGFRARFMENR
jgi:hypothetical protein